MVPGNIQPRVAILCGIALYPHVALATSDLITLQLSLAGSVSVSGQSQSTVEPTRHILPTGTAFPTSWRLTRIMSPTQQWGLTLDVFELAVALPTVRQWLPQLSPHCVELSGFNKSDSGHLLRLDRTERLPHEDAFNTFTNMPEHGPQLLWMCADSSRLYSLMQWQQTLLWTVSARHVNPPLEARGRFAHFLEEKGALELYTSSTLFERVSVYQTSRALVALQADMQVFRQRYGLEFQDHQRVHNGFLVTWQQGANRTHVSAVRQPDGRVVITHVTGTNL